ncbi:MAG: DnaJ domain-containing protein [Clostridia bacterium]
MEQNYYEILEVNKNASPEIIEKAYKTLVKKYHPDLQQDENKNKYEEKIKKINEAYDILSDPEKRKKYDLNLKNTEISINDYNSLYQENINLKNNLNILKEKLNYLNNIQNNYEKNNLNYNNLENNKNYSENNNINYNDINYTNYFSNFFVNIKNKLKDLFAFFITILIIIFIFFILWHIPFTKNYLIKLYNENSILQFFVNLFFGH